MSSSFRTQVEKYIAQVPSGMVTTYGDIAALAGQPAAPRIVGGIAHYGDPTLPWHRLVNRNGGLASGYWGGKSAQAALLSLEGVVCVEDKVVNFEERRWRPSNFTNR